MKPPTGRLCDFLPAQEALYCGGAELPGVLSKPLRRIAYVDEVDGENLGPVLSLRVERR